MNNNDNTVKNNADTTAEYHVITDPAVQKKLVFLLSTIIFFSVVNSTMFNVSLPDIVQQFRLLPSEASWVVSGFIIFFAIACVTYGKLADAYPAKNLIVIGLMLFNAGSLIGFLSQWYPMLIAARLVQAVGAGAIPALAMLIATRYFPVDSKGRILGAIASTVAFGGGVGPILGGFITGALHWRYLFIFSIVSLLTIPSLRQHLPDQARRYGRFDAAGALLLAGAVCSTLLFITLTVWWLMLSGIVLLFWFLVHINRVKNPFLNPSLFLNHRYRNMIVIAFLSVSTFFGMIFLTPLMLRDLSGLAAGGIGMVMFPGAMSGAATGTIGGKIIDKKGSAPVLYTGMMLLITGFFLLSIFAGWRPSVISLNLVLCYMGFSLIQSSLAHRVSSTLPADTLGVGMGVYNLFFFMSGAFSAAVIGKLLDISKGCAPVNPLTAIATAGSYSNLFLLLAAMVVVAAALLFVTSRSE